MPHPLRGGSSGPPRALGGPGAAGCSLAGSNAASGVSGGSGRGRRSFRIQLRYIDPRIKTDKNKIFETTFAKLNAPLTRLTPISTGFYAVSDNEQAIDKLLTPTAIQKLREVNLSPVIPPELRSKRTIFARQLDSHAGQHSPQEIETELIKNQPWLAGIEIVKIKEYTHVLKIICPDTSIANRILENGFNFFNTRVTPQQCEPEKFVHLLICYKCYEIESHPTKDCKITTIVCSECAQEGHTFRSCQSSTKACVNCTAPYNNHRTLAASCPYRKQKIAEKEKKQELEKQHVEQSTYANIVKQAVQQTKKEQPTPPTIQVSDQTHIKIVALILEAHIACLSGKGSYSKTLADSLKLNFNIDLKFPDRNSSDILNLLIKPPEKQQLATFLDNDEYIDDDDHATSPNLNPSNQSNTYTSSSEAESDSDDHHHPPIPPKRKTTEPDSMDFQPETTKRKASPEHSDSTKHKKRTIATDQDLSKVHNEIQIEEALTAAITPENFGLKLYKNVEDRTYCPPKPTPEYFYRELKKKEQGLKLSITQGSTDSILQWIKDGKLKPHPKLIQFLTPDQFARRPKYCIEPPHRKLSSSYK